MSFEGPIEDRLAIRELIDDYADAVFQRDEKRWAANWSEDAVWNLAGMEIKGKTSIVSMWNRAMVGFSFVAFFAAPGAINIAGNSATARVYTTEVLAETGGKLRNVIGQYDDAFVKQGGRWLFARRSYRILRDS
ncbi:MAG: nuclear transport factor 2 family protein [Rhizomicrobium sp.]